MGPIYIKVVNAIRKTGAVGADRWSQLEVADQIMHHVGPRVGPILEGLIEQVLVAQKGVPLSLGSELVWVWTPERPMVDPPLSWRNIMEAGDARRDVTVRMLWSAQIKVGAIEPIRDRMDGRGGASRGSATPRDRRAFGGGTAKSAFGYVY